MARTLYIKRGNLANLPLLSAGEFGLTLDEERLYVGKGNKNIAIPNAADLANKVNGANLTANIDIYVSTSGNDTTGDGTQSKPLRTLGKAIQYAKTLYGPYRIYIRLNDGTYLEDPIKMFNTWQGINITSVSGNKSSVIIRAKSSDDGLIYSAFGTYLSIANVTIEGYGPDLYLGTLTTSSAVLYLYNCVINALGTAKTQNAIVCTGGSTGLFNTVAINNAAAALAIRDGSMGYVNVLTGANNNIGLTSQGSLITKINVSITAATAESKTDGGQIF